MLPLAGCSAIFGFEEQCTTAADCTGPGQQCLSNLCVSPAVAGLQDMGAMTTTTGPDMASGTDMAERDAQSGMVDASMEMGPTKMTCGTHQDCGVVTGSNGTITKNEGQLCIKGFCEQVLFKEGKGECDELYGAVSVNPADTIVVPAVNELTGTAAAVGQRNTLDGYKLAFDVINDLGFLGSRRAVLLSCDNNTDLETAVAVMERAIEVTGAISVLGPGFADIADEVAARVSIPKGVLGFTRSTSTRYSTLPDPQDVAFRTIPNDTQSLVGIVALMKRFGPKQVGLFYREDQLSIEVGGKAAIQKINEIGIQVVAGPYDGRDPESIKAAAQAVANATDSEGDPLDYIILFPGQEDLDDVVRAYVTALRNGFTNKVPLFITPTAGSRELPLIAPSRDKSSTGAHPKINPALDLNAIVGNATVTTGFEQFFKLETNKDVFNTITAINYDSAMLLLLAHVAAGPPAPGGPALTGQDLSKAMRARILDLKAPEMVSWDRTSLTEAGARLSTGQTILYKLSAGGAVATINAAGDAEFQIVAAAYADNTFDTLFPARVLLPGGWLDFCSMVGSQCATKWTRRADEPPQACVPPPSPVLPTNICLPVCKVDGSLPCPAGAPFTCTAVPQFGAELCLPPGAGP